MSGLIDSWKGFVEDERAVSEVIGTVLIMALVMTGLAIVLILGGSIVTDSQDAAKFNGVEQALTMADSRISKARFGTAIAQEAPFVLRDGVVTVDESAGEILIEKVNPVPPNDELYRADLGAIIVDMEDGQLAYQGGGIFSADGKGGSAVISPPDFDYNGVTLTLPVMRITGSYSMAATNNREVVIGVEQLLDPTTKFPLDDANKRNPIPSGQNIRVTITSKYYLAWADYINQRTRAIAVATPIVGTDIGTATVDLKTGTPLQSGLASQGFTTEAMDTSYDAPIEVFKLNLLLRNTGNDYTIDFGVPDIAGADPDPQLVISVTRTTGNDNKEYAYIAYDYSHATPSGTVEHETFEKYIDFARKSDETIDLDMLSRDIRLDCVSAPGGFTDSWGKNEDSSWQTPGVLDTNHDIVDYEDYPDDIAVGQSKCLNDLTQHYLLLMAQHDQANGGVQNGPFYEVLGKQKYDGGSSTVKIGFKSSEDIKYLYITEGELTTTLTSRS